MDNEKMALEFEFIRDRLKKVAGCLCHANGNPSELVEASFMVGCLHSICHQHYIDFQKKSKQENTNEKA